MPKILLIEDEKDIAALIELHAKNLGYSFLWRETSAQGYQTVLSEKPDLVILDLMLPDGSGIEVCKKIRQTEMCKHLPLIILTAKAQEEDVLAGLSLGADDYVTKPFSPKVLFSRIHALLRRAHPQEKTFVFGEFTLDVAQYVLKKNAQSIPLTLSEFEILKRLLMHSGKVLTRDQLLQGIQGGSDIMGRNIDVHIVSLRKKMGSGFIETVRGVGYRLIKENS